MRNVSIGMFVIRETAPILKVVFIDVCIFINLLIYLNLA